MSEKSSNSPSSINTLIGPQMSVEGDVSCPGVLRVQGELNGNVSCNVSPDGRLVVDGEGRVNGSVRARHIAVRGRVVGPLQSAHSVEIHDGGAVTGNVLYKKLSIHAGGVVEGVLKPLNLADDDAQEPPRPAPQGTGGERRRGTRMAVAAVLAAAVAGALLWRVLPLADPPADSVPLKADTALRDAGSSDTPHDDRKASLVDPLPPADSSTPAPAKESVPPPERPETDQARIQTVKGVNPGRPSGVFLLIANEPSVLYRKKRDEPGEGARITVAEGERASVAIASDEVIRIAKGTDITMFYQGQKVPRQLIASGSWISFVAR